MFTERTMIDRLLKIHGAANADALSAATWYRDVAARDVARIAAETGTPFTLAAAVTAILSPGPKYATNVKDARAMLAWATKDRQRTLRPTCSTYGPNVAKVDALLADWLAGGDAEDAGRYVSGPKVTNFFRNICGDLSHVALDRHAVRPISKAGKDTPTGKVERARMESAYRKAAAKVGLEPAEFQAVVWVAVRGAVE